MNRLYFTVTNDLSYDQRMIRICHSLAEAGYRVTLVGRKLKKSIPLTKRKFEQKRLVCFFNKGKLFYLEYNIRLFVYLLCKKMDGICAIDLDTILPCLLVSKIKNTKRIYDAHELFCEMKEVVSRPGIYKAWKWLERKTVPRFSYGYTVNETIAQVFHKDYARHYEVIRNMPLLNPAAIHANREKFILYQGAVNEGRSFETLLPAMRKVPARLVICGDGNFMEQTKALILKYKLEDKVIVKGMLPPEALVSINQKAYIGITLFEKNGDSNYYSLANRFFDYIHAGIPQLCVDYPEYRKINDEYDIAFLVPNVQEETIAAALNELIQDDEYWNRLHQNCIKAAQHLNWQQEEIKLKQFYKNIFGESFTYHQP